MQTLVFGLGIMQLFDLCYDITLLKEGSKCKDGTRLNNLD